MTTFNLNVPVMGTGVLAFLSKSAGGQIVKAAFNPLTNVASNAVGKKPMQMPDDKGRVLPEISITADPQPQSIPTSGINWGKILLWAGGAYILYYAFQNKGE